MGSRGEALHLGGRVWHPPGYSRAGATPARPRSRRRV